jgi:hypothetical protein
VGDFLKLDAEMKPSHSASEVNWFRWHKTYRTAKLCITSASDQILPSTYLNAATVSVNNKPFRRYKPQYICSNTYFYISKISSKHTTISAGYKKIPLMLLKPRFCQRAIWEGITSIYPWKRSLSHPEIAVAKKVSLSLAAKPFLQRLAYLETNLLIARVRWPLGTCLRLRVLAFLAFASRSRPKRGNYFQGGMCVYDIKTRYKKL